MSNSKETNEKVVSLVGNSKEELVSKFENLIDSELDQIAGGGQISIKFDLKIKY